MSLDKTSAFCSGACWYCLPHASKWNITCPSGQLTLSWLPIIVRLCWPFSCLQRLETTRFPGLPQGKIFTIGTKTFIQKYYGTRAAISCLTYFISVLKNVLNYSTRKFSTRILLRAFSHNEIRFLLSQATC
jgi:hypothetical protein